MQKLRHIGPEIFNVSKKVPNTLSFDVVINVFKSITTAYLPADQGQLLIKAAGKVLAVFSESSNHAEESTRTASEETSLSAYLHRSRSISLDQVLKNKLQSGDFIADVDFQDKVKLARPDLLQALLNPTTNDIVNDTIENDNNLMLNKNIWTKAFSPTLVHSYEQIATVLPSKSKKVPYHGSVINTKPGLLVVPRQSTVLIYVDKSFDALSLESMEKELARDPVAALFPMEETQPVELMFNKNIDDTSPQIESIIKQKQEVYSASYINSNNLTLNGQFHSILESSNNSSQILNCLSPKYPNTDGDDEYKDEKGISSVNSVFSFVSTDPCTESVTPTGSQFQCRDDPPNTFTITQRDDEENEVENDVNFKQDNSDLNLIVSDMQNKVYSREDEDDNSTTLRTSSQPTESFKVSNKRI
jgi:hypothetical protein